MAKYVYRGGGPVYYPATGFYANIGETHDWDTPPDTNWKLVEADTASSTPVVAPSASEPAQVAETVAPAVAEPATPVDQTQDAVHAAEALLEANPELARKLVEEAAKNA